MKIIEEPLVSIIIPVYNTKPYLERCIQSVVQQTYKQLEILLIDEGTSALDKESAKSLVEMLLGNKELTIIMISHDMSDELRGKFDNIIKL